MKMGIIGAGKVGCACLVAAAMRGSAREIVLINRTRKRAEAIAADLRYGMVLGPKVSIRAGEYSDLNEAGVVLIAAGINEKTGHATDRDDVNGRLNLLARNAEIYRDIVPRIVEAAPRAVLIAVSDPPDPLADVIRKLAGHGRVLSTGTFLDSARLRVHLGAHFAIDPGQIEAQVIGEHGISQVFLWSSASIGGVLINEWVKRRGEDFDQFKSSIESAVRFANIAIIEGNDASQYGIGIVSTRLAEIVFRDERAVVPVGSYQEPFGVTFSMPSIVGEGGVTEVLAPELSDHERHALEASAVKLKDALAGVMM